MGAARSPGVMDLERTRNNAAGRLRGATSIDSSVLHFTGKRDLLGGAERLSGGEVAEPRWGHGWHFLKMSLRTALVGVQARASERRRSPLGAHWGPMGRRRNCLIEFSEPCSQRALIAAWNSGCRVVQIFLSGGPVVAKCHDTV